MNTYRVRRAGTRGAAALITADDFQKAAGRYIKTGGFQSRIDDGCDHAVIRVELRTGGRKDCQLWAWDLGEGLNLLKETTA
jgi:hypothetical protein